jgi:hypothetical protein
MLLRAGWVLESLPKMNVCVHFVVAEPVRPLKQTDRSTSEDRGLPSLLQCIF